MRKLLHEPLLHFVLLAAALFALHGWLAAGRGGEDRRIVITQGRIAQLAAGYALMHQRPPDAGELRGLVDDAIREEVLYREALALGLDRDDTIVRRRLRQKLEFVSEDVGPAAEPTQAQLQAFLDAHAARFRREPGYWFRQVYFRPQAHRALAGDVARALASLRRGEAADAGDALLLPARFDGIGAAEAGRLFGADFERALGVLPTGEWQGPVASTYGVHLVRIERRDAARAARLAEVRDAVRAEWQRVQRERANAQYYADLRKRYRVTVEAFPAAPGGVSRPGPSGQAAP